MVAFVPHIERVEAENVAGLVAGYDLVLDGTDNFGPRAIVADATQAAGGPLVSGAVSMFDGQVTVFMPGGRTFRDLYPDTPDDADLPACEVVGALGAVTGVIGTLMAMEAIKLITGIGDPLIGRLLLYDGRRPLHRTGNTRRLRHWRSAGARGSCRMRYMIMVKMTEPSPTQLRTAGSHGPAQRAEMIAAGVLLAGGGAATFEERRQGQDGWRQARGEGWPVCRSQGTDRRLLDHQGRFAR